MENTRHNRISKWDNGIPISENSSSVCEKNARQVHLEAISRLDATRKTSPAPRQPEIDLTSGDSISWANPLNIPPQPSPRFPHQQGGAGAAEAPNPPKHRGHRTDRALFPKRLGILRLGDQEYAFAEIVVIQRVK